MSVPPKPARLEAEFDALDVVPKLQVQISRSRSRSGSTSGARLMGDASSAGETSVPLACKAHDLCMYAPCVRYFFDGLLPGQMSELRKIFDSSICSCLKHCAPNEREGILIGIDNLLMQMTFCQWNDGAPNDKFDTTGCNNGGGGFVPPPRHLDPRVADPRRG